jgi:hypothetical protein
MMEEELRIIWQSSANEERLKFEKSRLIMDVQLSLDRIHKSIRFRDLIETIGAMTVVPVFVYYAYTIPFTLSKIASVLIALWAIFVIVQLRKAKKHKPGAYTETYLEYLLKTRDYLLVQKRLLDTVLYWYILPCLALMFLFLMGFIGIPEKFTWLMITATAAVVSGIIIYFLNKRAVKKGIIPRLNKVEELIKLMEE